jgi:hypothetical protein
MLVTYKEKFHGKFFNVFYPQPSIIYSAPSYREYIRKKQIEEHFLSLASLLLYLEEINCILCRFMRKGDCQYGILANKFRPMRLYSNYGLSFIYSLIEKDVFLAWNTA